MHAVMRAMVCRQVMDEAAFQAEVFKLRSREWPYYLAANRDSLQAVPDLSDLSGGLSNPTQFNFLMYILWKARQETCSCSWGSSVAGAPARELLGPECFA